MMESDTGESRPLARGVSSDEGELLGNGVDRDLASRDSNDGPPVESRKRKSEDCGTDDECLVLDGDPEKLDLVPRDKGNGDGSEAEDLMVVGESGQVACRDYPHSRHDCVKFPFNTSPHVEHCNLCHCYVCDLPAPCIYWGTGVSNSDHCHATDKDEGWKVRRKGFKLGKSAGQNTLGNDCGVLTNRASLADQNIHPGSIDSAAYLTLQNPGSQQVVTYDSGQIMLPVNTTRNANLPQRSLVSGSAIHHPSSQSLRNGYNSLATSPNHVARQPNLRRCSPSVSYGSSDSTYHYIGQQHTENPLHAPRTVSPGFNVLQPDICCFRRNVRPRPRHVSSVARYRKIGPPASRSGCAVPSGLYWATPGQFGGQFQNYTAVSVDHNNFPRQSCHPSPHFGPDTWSMQFNAPGMLPDVMPFGSSGSYHPGGGISVEVQTVDSVYQHIQDARAVDPLDYSGHQNHGDAFQHAALAIDHQPVQQSNHHSPQYSGLSSAAINNNWLSETPLYQGQLPVHSLPAAATADVDVLFFDFNTTWDDVPE